MLRAVSLSARVLPAAGVRRSAVGAQWPLTRRFADAKGPDKAVFPGSQSTSAGRVGANPPPTISPSPSTPSSSTTIPPENVPRTPPSPAEVQSAPPTTQASVSPPPPPPAPPKKKKNRTRTFLIYLIALLSLSYAGGVYYSLVSDNFHDFFTEYVPYGEEAVLYFEEREFKRRFADGGKPPLRPQPKGEPKRTISGKSGVSARVSGETSPAADLTKAGKHVSAVSPAGDSLGKPDRAVAGKAAETPKPKGPEKPNTSDQPKTSEQSKGPPAESSAARVATLKAAEAKPVATKSEAKTPETASTSKAAAPIAPIDSLKVENAEDPIVQKVTKIVNDIIAVVNADNAAGKYSTTLAKAKTDLKELSTDISTLKASAANSTEKQIQEKQTQFQDGVKELVRRVEAEMKQQELQWREEYEAERQRLSHDYELKLKAELESAQKVADQRLQNSLLERDIKLKDDFAASVRDRVESERSARLSKLNELSSSVNELEDLTGSWNEVIDTNLKTQHLVVAVEAVRTTLESMDRPRPFLHELAVLKEIANEDAVVNAAIASINPAAYQRGIPTPAQLIDRFRRVAAEVRKAALLPADAGVASHATSLLLSKVLFKKQGLAMGDDVESVLTRTETYLEEGNLNDAAREMNGLTGWAKVLSKDWLGECRTVLEVRQALDVIATEARLQSLMVE